jgi:hypothetical protein
MNQRATVAKARRSCCMLMTSAITIAPIIGSDPMQRTSSQPERLIRVHPVRLSPFWGRGIDPFAELSANGRKASRVTAPRRKSGRAYRGARCPELGLLLRSDAQSVVAEAPCREGDRGRERLRAARPRLTDKPPDPAVADRHQLRRDDLDTPAYREPGPRVELVNSEQVRCPIL